MFESSWDAMLKKSCADANIYLFFVLIYLEFLEFLKGIGKAKISI